MVKCGPCPREWGKVWAEGARPLSVFCLLQCEDKATVPSEDAATWHHPGAGQDVPGY